MTEPMLKLEYLKLAQAALGKPAKAEDIKKLAASFMVWISAP